MNNSVYKINKGINKPIEFKGLKAQYIWWLAGGFLIMLAFFALLYFIGVNTYVCVAIVLVLGAVMVMLIYRVSDTYGEHGLLKRLAKRNMPERIICRSRKSFGKHLVSDRRSLTF